MAEKPEMYISSLIDTWILVRNFEYNGERNRGLTILKSRGMPHSNQIREFVMTDNGIELLTRISALPACSWAAQSLRRK